MGKVASDFEKIINEGRERKQNEALAAKIFNKDRRASAPLKASGPGGSLASRVGVKKRSSLGPRAQTTTVPAGNINGEWTHDLHNATLPAKANNKAANKPNSLASRIHAPGTKAPAQQQQARQQRRAAQTAQALIKAELDPAFAAQQVNVVKGGAANAANAATSNKPAWKGQGMTIRGLAGPFVVMAQNFAPGTTAADIESAMTPVGGLISSCRLLKTQPIVIAEIVFESKEGAENVIDTFNNQTADGRVLHVYPKTGGPSPPQRAPPTGPRAAAATNATSNNSVVDGSLGFDDPMDTDTPNSRLRQNGRTGGGGGGGGGASSGLYSDQLVNNNGRRGRGFQRGGRGGSGR